ncbi:hypothetical protein [Pelagibaculum spongiae]|uniref:Peptidase C58 YopT-type domain-containing protein n=1 Tax=Pelagibaculum spongiae TaxID=2080658 RepID=A0A2V1GRJ0_9GAMM|nr:hypothetical protein [Pelagibaculum spongiae]PVZ67621.1 hypothetical protein DC094_14370 [Pelagibaculum spongiae]
MPYKEPMNNVYARWHELGINVIYYFNQKDYIDAVIEEGKDILSEAYIAKGLCTTLSVYWLKYYPTMEDFYKKIKSEYFKRHLMRKDMSLQIHVPSKTSSLHKVKASDLIKGKNIKLTISNEIMSEYIYNRKLYSFCSTILETPISSFMLILSFRGRAGFAYSLSGNHVIAVRVNMVNQMIDVFDPNLGVIRISRHFHSSLSFVLHDLIRSYYKSPYAKITATQLTSITSSQ